MIFQSLSQWQEFRNTQNLISLGFVPTMGALHEGHLALIKKSQNECAKTLVSIFVNPTQFNDVNDLENYPRPLKEDLKLLAQAKVDYILLPTYTELYPDHYRYKVQETHFSSQLCGQSRPGHFEGVLTIVLKLLNLSKAKRAYFGEKDYQQFLLIREMAKAFFLDTEIVSHPTVRDQTGLALSSRNRRLSHKARLQAALLYQVLQTSKSLDQARESLLKAGFKIDYLEEILGRRFAAVWLEGVRLIDNVKLTNTSNQEVLL